MNDLDGLDEGSSGSALLVTGAAVDPGAPKPVVVNDGKTVATGVRVVVAGETVPASFVPHTPERESWTCTTSDCHGLALAPGAQHEGYVIVKSAIPNVLVFTADTPGSDDANPADNTAKHGGSRRRSATSPQHGGGARARVLSAAMRWSSVAPVLVLLSLASIAACSGNDGDPVPTPSTTTGDAADAAGDDAAPPDAGAETGGADAGSDTSRDDAASDADAPPFDIIGVASGACGAITALVTSPSSAVVDVPLAFDATDEYERARLSPGGQKVFDAPNAGGSSKESEVMTFELLHHCEDAVLLKTETEIEYGPPPDGGAATITDMIVSIGGAKIGVNPKRVFKPLPLTMTDAEVRDQLVKNFESIKASSARVLPEDRWLKQILHVWVPSATYYDAVVRVLPTIDEATKSNTIVLLTRSTGGGFLYCDPDPPLGTECPPIK